MRLPTSRRLRDRRQARPVHGDNRTRMTAARFHTRRLAMRRRHWAPPADFPSQLSSRLRQATDHRWPSAPKPGRPRGDSMRLCSPHLHSTERPHGPARPIRVQGCRPRTPAHTHAYRPLVPAEAWANRQRIPAGVDPGPADEPHLWTAVPHRTTTQTCTEPLRPVRRDLAALPGPAPGRADWATQRSPARLRATGERNTLPPPPTTATCHGLVYAVPSRPARCDIRALPWPRRSMARRRRRPGPGAPARRAKPTAGRATPGRLAKATLRVSRRIDGPAHSRGPQSEPTSRNAGHHASASRRHGTPRGTPARRDSAGRRLACSLPIDYRRRHAPAGTSAPQASRLVRTIPERAAQADLTAGSSPRPGDQPTRAAACLQKPTRHRVPRRRCSTRQDSPSHARTRQPQPTPHPRPRHNQPTCQRPRMPPPAVPTGLRVSALVSRSRLVIAMRGSSIATDFARHPRTHRLRMPRRLKPSRLDNRVAFVASWRLPNT